MESSAGCLGAGFANGGANNWALDLQTMGSFRSPAGPRMGAGLWGRCWGDCRNNVSRNDRWACLFKLLWLIGFLAQPRGR